MPDYTIATVNPVSSVDWNNMADRLREGAANRAFQKNISRGDQFTLDANGNKVYIPAGQLNQRQYINDIADLGLGPDYTNRYLEQNVKTNAAIKDQLLTDQLRKNLGVSGEPAPRPGASTGAPAPVKKASVKLGEWFEARKKSKELNVPEPELVVRTGPVDDSTPLQSAEFTGMSTSNPTPQQPQTSEQQVPENITKTLEGYDLGSSTLKPEQMKSPVMQLPELKSEPVETYIPQDTRSVLQYEQDRYDPSQGIAAKMAGQTQDGGSQPITKWEPVDDGTNQYRQFKASLDAKLKANGFASADDYLKQIHAQTMAANTPPMPSESLLAMGLEGQAKYQDQYNAYIAGLAQARGKADEAVMKARDGLTEIAKAYGVDTVEDRKTLLSPGVRVKNEADFDAASALASNRGFIRKISADIDNAGDNVATLTAILPQLARGMATAWSPGQQINEGNLSENVGTLYNGLQTQNGQPVEEAAKTAFLRLLFKGDAGGITDLNNRLDATSVKVLKQRMKAAAEEAKNVTDERYKHYTTDTAAYEYAVENGSNHKPDSTTGKPTGTARKQAEALKARTKKAKSDKAKSDKEFTDGIEGWNK